MKRIIDVLNYKNENLVLTIMQKLSLSREEAIEALRDTLKFLLFCTRSNRPLAPPRNIDEVWHLFILSTVSYAKFCKEYLGRFIHHRPAINGKVPGINADLESLHYNTMAVIKKFHEEIGEPLSGNFISGVSVYDWCCHGTEIPDPTPNPEDELAYVYRFL